MIAFILLYFFMSLFEISSDLWGHQQEPFNPFEHYPDESDDIIAQLDHSIPSPRDSFYMQNDKTNHTSSSFPAKTFYFGDTIHERSSEEIFCSYFEKSSPEQKLQKSISPASNSSNNNLTIKIQPNLSMEVENQDEFLTTTNKNKKLKISKKLKNQGDIDKNIYPNVIKQVFKAYNDPKYFKKVKRIHQKLGIKDSYQAKNVYFQMKDQAFSFQKVYAILKQQKQDPEEKLQKAAFVSFLEWYLRRQYSLYILTQRQPTYRKRYLQLKNILIHLPNSTLKAKMNIQQPILTEKDHSSTEDYLWKVLCSFEQE